MKAYRTYLTVTDAKQVVLNDVPFQPGQRVEVLVLTKNDVNGTVVQEFQTLLEETQALPHIQALTDEEIAAEVASFRNEQ